MIDQELCTLLAEISGPENIRFCEPMSKHTSFKAGGPAAVYCMPPSVDALSGMVSLLHAKGVPYYIIGCGSNLLVSDAGYDGVMIEIGRNLAEIETDKDAGLIRAGAGAQLGAIAVRARDASLTGFEFASGIPGSLGGACVMNAGAYGGEMKDVLVSVTLMDQTGRILTKDAGELSLSYRFSSLMDSPYVVIEALIRLEPGDREEITSRMKDLNQRRIEKQPLEYPSAGSTFKRPEGYFAGKLIEDAGLKGFSIGDAQVSEKHAGFVINKGGASAADIYRLTCEIIRIVKEKTGVELQREIRLLGQWE